MVSYSFTRGVNWVIRKHQLLVSDCVEHFIGNHALHAMMKVKKNQPRKAVFCLSLKIWNTLEATRIFSCDWRLESFRYFINTSPWIYFPQLSIAFPMKNGEAAFICSIGALRKHSFILLWWSGGRHSQTNTFYCFCDLFHVRYLDY